MGYCISLNVIEVLCIKLDMAFINKYLYEVDMQCLNSV